MEIFMYISQNSDKHLENDLFDEEIPAEMTAPPRYTPSYFDSVKKGRKGAKEKPTLKSV